MTGDYTSGDLNNNTINYLGLIIFIDSGQMHTKNYFKAVDYNSFLDYRSNHSKKWLNNIPYGQFRSIRCNCTKNKDFVTQSKILSERFKDKKYPPKLIMGAYIKVSRLTQKDCITPKNKIMRIKPIRNLKVPLLPRLIIIKCTLDKY